MLKEACRDLNTPLVNLRDFIIRRGLPPEVAQYDTEVIKSAFKFCVLYNEKVSNNFKIGIYVKETDHGGYQIGFLVLPVSLDSMTLAEQIVIAKGFRGFFKQFTGHSARINVGIVDADEDQKKDSYKVALRISKENSSIFMGVLSADTLGLTSH
jgi:hypothetical protein